MKFIRDLLGKKRYEPQIDRIEPLEQLEQSYRDTIGALDRATPEIDAAKPDDTSLDVPALAPTRPNALRLAAASRVSETAEDLAVEAPAAPAAPVNIWDLEDDGSGMALPDAPAPAPEAPAPAAASAAAARSPARSRRTKTRLIGFEQSDGAVVDLFNDAPTAAPSKSVKFPVGWLVVAEGPGRGESFSLLAGMSQIGRGEDQAVQLDFGDNSISRTNHAAIVYDPTNKEFLLGHGGKSNIVRLNDKPVISNETLKTGDIIRIGETVLRFVALCDSTFNWSDGATEEDEDVAIA
ncbi:FHA domain-containing protein [Yoonia sp.]|uniref:FHA domain-containing protein n=1 Tax=Yoonia sp. TaxID=2212373 RepID=UPI0035C7C001